MVYHNLLGLISDISWEGKFYIITLGNRQYHEG